MQKSTIFFFLFILSLQHYINGEEAINTIQPQDFHLQTRKNVKEFSAKDVGTAWIVTKNNFPALDGVTCYTLELWDESMRVPHWHPNASELGYVISGTIEIILWRSPGETSVFTLSEGMCWFIPQGSLHCLNNLGKEKAELLVGFASDEPQDIDLPVAFNGVPAPIRNAYTSPHSELRKWVGSSANPLVSKYTPDISIKDTLTGSPYKFDLAAVTPLFNNPLMGSVTWGVRSNWSILENISVLRAHLKPGVARDAIWYPDAGTLYVVSKGRGQFHIIVANQDPHPIEVARFDYIFVPTGTLHTFINNSSEDFEVVAFFNQENPLPEVSLSVATAFFPNAIRRDTMSNSKQKGDPLKDLNYKTTSPYLLQLQ